VRLDFSDVPVGGAKFLRIAVVELNLHNDRQNKKP
jgi:hypothetical protein